MTAVGRVAPQYRTPSRPAAGDVCRTVTAPRGAALAAARDPYARLARGCKPRGCRAPARRVHGRRVRYVIGSEPGQVNGMRWRVVRACDCR
jgi:hypothetical protein